MPEGPFTGYRRQEVEKRSLGPKFSGPVDCADLVNFLQRSVFSKIFLDLEIGWIEVAIGLMRPESEVLRPSPVPSHAFGPHGRSAPSPGTQCMRARLMRLRGARGLAECGRPAAMRRHRFLGAA